MTDTFRDHFAAHLDVVQKSVAAIESATNSAGKAIADALASGNKVLTFGNGGSSAEASHLAEELVGRYKKTRRPFPALCLSSDGAAVTCISNDFGYETLFERQIEAFAQPGDVAVALTTSGKSENVVRGLIAARLKGAVTIALTGEAGVVGASADHVVAVPSRESALIQEVHLVVVHIWCQMVDDISF
jgi:D-sedoheptulose 7-phosphate isomerase